ncbi:MAG: hypothetical protein R6W82_05790 [bacterium]
MTLFKTPPLPARGLAVLLSLLLLAGCSLTRSTEEMEGTWEASWTASRGEDIRPGENILTLQVGGDGMAEAAGRYRYVNDLQEEALQRVELLVVVGSGGRLSGRGWWYLEVLPFGRHIRETAAVSGRLDAESYTGEMTVSFTTGLSEVRLSFDLSRTR